MLQLREFEIASKNMNYSNFIDGYYFDIIEIIKNITATAGTGISAISENSTIESDNDPGVLQLIGDILSLYYTPFIGFGGSIGNILCVVVLFKTKLKKLSSSYYLAALAVSDTSFLFGALMQWLNFIGIGFYNLNVFCQFFTYQSYLSSFLSVWFVVAFTVERFIAVMYPLQRQSMCTVRRAKIVLIGLTFAGCIHCAPMIYFASPVYHPEMNQTICDVQKTNKHAMNIYNYVDTAVVFVIPFTTIAILNTFMGCTVWKFATVRRKMTALKSETKTARTPLREAGSENSNNVRTHSTVSATCAHPKGRNSISLNNNSTSCRRKVSNSSQMKVTKMLLIVSTVFVCLNLPSYVTRAEAFLERDILDAFIYTKEPCCQRNVIREMADMIKKEINGELMEVETARRSVSYVNNDMNGHMTKTMIIIQYICGFLFITNFGINFVLYCLSGQNFRRAVVSVFRKASSAREGTTQITVSDFSRNSGATTSRRRHVHIQNELSNDGRDKKMEVYFK